MSDDAPTPTTPNPRSDLENRITELQTRNSELENERRMWKHRAEARGKLLQAVLGMWAHRFGDDDREAREHIAAVAARADRLEADAWTKATALAREFVKAAAEPMGDYAPDIVTPMGEGHRGGYDTTGAADTPRAWWIRRWVERFKAATE